MNQTATNVPLPQAQCFILTGFMKPAVAETPCDTTQYSSTATATNNDANSSFSTTLQNID